MGEYLKKNPEQEGVHFEAEDNYRSCVKHGSEEEAKPKRKSRKKQDDDE